jgi:hypothetical protein
MTYKKQVNGRLTGMVTVFFLSFLSFFPLSPAWTMYFQIMMKERPTKCTFKIKRMFRISILLLHVSALQECHLQGA